MAKRQEEIGRATTHSGARPKPKTRALGDYQDSITDIGTSANPCGRRDEIRSSTAVIGGALEPTLASPFNGTLVELR